MTVRDLIAAVALTVAGTFTVGVLVWQGLSRAFPEPNWKA